MSRWSPFRSTARRNPEWWEDTTTWYPKVIGVWEYVRQTTSGATYANRSAFGPRTCLLRSHGRDSKNREVGWLLTIEWTEGKYLFRSFLSYREAAGYLLGMSDIFVIHDLKGDTDPITASNISLWDGGEGIEYKNWPTDKSQPSFLR